MRRVLDVVGEGDDLGIVVVTGCERLAKGHAQQAGCPAAEDDQRLHRPAVRTVPAQLVPFAARDHALRAEHWHEPVRAAAGASRRFAAGVHEAAGVAERGVDAANAGRRIIGREEVPHVDVAGEEPVVEHAQVLIDPLLRGTPDRAPAGDAALAALDERQVDRRLVGLEIVREPQAGRLVRARLAEPAHHPPQLAHPEMQPHLEERPGLPRAGRSPGAGLCHGREAVVGEAPRLIGGGVHRSHGGGRRGKAVAGGDGMFEGAIRGGRIALQPAGDRDQRAQPVQYRDRLSIVRHREAWTKAFGNLRQRLRAAFEHAQQVDEGEVLAQALCKRHPPLGGVDVPVDGFAEEDLVLGPDVALDRGVPGVVHPRGQVVTREQGAADDRAAEEFVDALPDLAEDGFGIEGLIEDARYVVDQLLAALLASDRGRGPDADQPLAGHPEP